jgi:hypothetical protein
LLLYHDEASFNAPSLECIQAEQLEHCVSYLPPQADYDDGPNPQLFRDSPAPSQHDSLANPDFWTEFLAGVYCLLQTVARGITYDTELDNDQTICMGTQTPGSISRQARHVSPLPANSMIPDCVDFNHPITPSMTTLSSHSLSLPDQASVSLSDHHYGHFTLDLQGSEFYSRSTSSGSSVTGPPSLGGGYCYEFIYYFLNTSYRV